MKKQFHFYKNESEEWYLDLPEWQGDPADLQMVQGADTWLDLVANGKPSVDLLIADESFENAHFLTLIRLGEENLGGGGNYYLEKYNGVEVGIKIWICDVTVFVFDTYPQRIFFEAVQ